jgi:acetylornithine deacetylase/succinyl-diaminopimelate desuccinylase-like protein
MPSLSVRWLFLLGCFATFSSAIADEKADVEKRLSESAKLLASDEWEGRGVGTEGLNKAAEYIAQQFASMGLKTDSFDGTPFQKFNVVTHSEPGKQNRLKLAGPPVEGGQEPRTWDLEMGKDFTPLAVGGGAAFDAPLVFAGYGITAKDLEYDDYANLDVKGKVVIILRKEPEQNNPHSKFNGNDPSAYAPFMAKISNANGHEAAGIIFVNSSNDLSDRLKSEQQAFDALADRLAKSREEFKAKKDATPEDEKKFRAESAKIAEELGAVGKRMQGDMDQVLPFNGAGPESTHRKLPVMFASRAKIDIVLKAALNKDLATLEKEIDSDLKPRSAELKDWKAIGETSIDRKEAEVKNVIAVLEGEGPHANETVVVGAHYDHLGHGGFGSLAPWTSDIHNGADDNASGTATLLEIARQLAAREKKPARRIVFMAFTGEERGLLGSAHYVKQPKFPLENTVAMINLDMVGRLKDNKLIIYGTGTAKEFEGLIDDLNKKYEFDVTRKPGGFGPSDHASFYAKKIPVFHLFTGTHSDYHRPSDDTDKLNVEGMARITAMTTEMVDRIANAEQKPTYVENKRQETIVASGGGERAYFGSIPDYSDEVDGLALTGVAPEGPAEKAGVKGGDVIVQFGESKISGIEDFQAALTKHKPGDKVKFKVKRGAETLDLEVTLGRPKG